MRTPHELDKREFVNQHGLGRKVHILISSRPISVVCHLSSQHIFDSMKRSLERLQLDYIDVLQATASIPVHQSRRRCRLYTTSSRRDMSDTFALVTTLGNVSARPHEVGIIPWSPFVRGLLTRPFTIDAVTHDTG